MKVDFLVVGAGLFGATFANQMWKKGYRVAIIDSASYIGGHCNSYQKDGIEIHKYGPHIFHTGSDEVWEFVNRFSKFTPFNFTAKAFYRGKLYSFPINLLTLHQVFGCTSPHEARRCIENDIVKIDHPTNLEERALSVMGPTLYEIFIKGYTKKQWATDPKNLPASILNRLPIRFDFSDSYFLNHRNKYQGIPTEGYARLIENMIFETNCPCILDKKFDQKLDIVSKAKRILYTGPIDEFFDYCYGHLPYRSSKFEFEKHPNTFQGGPVVNYTDESVPYTRITEHKYFMTNFPEHTWISKEFPIKYIPGENAPFYPINTDENNALYLRYKKLAEQISDKVIFGGRLGMYAYYDMDQTIEAAINLSGRF